MDENQNNIEEYKKNDDKEEDAEKKEDSEDSDDETEEEDDEKKKAASKNTLEEKYALIESQLNELQTKCELLEKENEELKNFKAEIDSKEKDALIDSFYMLSDEDKKDVIENKANYSLEDIEAKLSVICVRKKVNFNIDNETEKKDEVPTIFNLDSSCGDDTPAWLKRVEERKNNND